MLGFICNVSRNVFLVAASQDNARFVPTSPCLPHSDRPGWRALDARHGRVLLYSRANFVVWDPITGEEMQLPSLPTGPPYPLLVRFNAAVLCAGVAAGVHLDGHFLVVFVGIYYNHGMVAYVYVYSSEAGAWSEPTNAQYPSDDFDFVPAAVVGNAVYFVFRRSTRILKYDLGTREMSLIGMPSTSHGRIILIATDWGRLGFTIADDDFKLYLYSMEVGPHDDVVWTQDRVIELRDLLPANALLSLPVVVGYVNGHGVIFVGTEDGFYTIDLKSNQARKVGEGIACMRNGDIGYGHTEINTGAHFDTVHQEAHPSQSGLFILNLALVDPDHEAQRGFGIWKPVQILDSPSTMAPPLPPPPPALMEELVEECLLRFPPDDPTSLVCAALVSKQWSRLISGGGFGRRFREFHRTPPTLAFLCNLLAAGSSFVPTSPSFCPPNADHHGLRAVHSGHGRVLLHHTGGNAARPGQFVVWDPITDERRELPMGPPFPLSWDAAVLCAAGGDDCNHLGCHRGPFLVVFVGSHLGKIFSCVYSSEANMWSEPIYTQGSYYFMLGNSLLLGSALYFKPSSSRYIDRFFLRYDLLTQEMSAIRLPVESAQQHIALMPTEDGRLGFAAAHRSMHVHVLCLWSTKHGPDEGAIWARDKVIGIDRLKIGDASEVQVAGFAGNGAGGVVFLWTDVGFFTIDLKSGKSKRVGESLGFSRIAVPYVSFCTPALQVASAAVGPSPSASSA